LIWIFIFYFLNWYIFFKFHHLTSSWLWIKLCHLFRFIFYEVISTSWPESWVLRVNLDRFMSFYCIFLDCVFFFQFHHLIMSLLEIKFYNLFSFLYIELLWFKITRITNLKYYLKLTWINKIYSHFIIFFSQCFYQLLNIWLYAFLSYSIYTKHKT
jgi:hypothetical protein